jgi:hypothetical protein
MNGEGEGNHLTFGKIILIGALAIAGILIVNGYEHDGQPLRRHI